MLQAIKYINQKNIDKDKWDACIENAGNSLIYAYSWYLDIVSPNWNALIFGDYEVVMPLTWRKKYGIKYICQPDFTRLLGVFGVNVNKSVCAAFFKSIPDDYRLVEIDLNSNNNLKLNNVKTTNKLNHELFLNISYLIIKENYSRSHLKNLRRANKNELMFKQTTDYGGISHFMASEMARATPNIKGMNYNLLTKILETKRKGVSVDCYEVLREGKTLAVACFVQKGEHIFSQFVASKEGKNLKALFYLIDKFIEIKAGQNVYIDFYGSNIPTIAYFFEGFGAKPRIYQSLKISRLPWGLKFLKR